MMKHTVLLSFLIAFILGLIGILIFPYYTINPGVVIQDHSMLKNDCLSCHSLGEGAQTEKCIICHSPSEIGLKLVGGIDRNDSNSKSNLLHQSIINIRCFDCHTEHNGLSRKNATLKFRHDILATELQNECTKCHLLQKPRDEIHKYLMLNCSEFTSMKHGSRHILNTSCLVIEKMNAKIATKANGQQIQCTEVWVVRFNAFSATTQTVGSHQHSIIQNISGLMLATHQTVQTAII